MDIENAVLKLKLSDESLFTVTGIIGFRCVKERYTPYSVLDVTAVCSEHISDVLEVRFEIGGRVIHRGMTDSMTVTESGGTFSGYIAEQAYDGKNVRAEYNVAGQRGNGAVHLRQGA